MADLPTIGLGFDLGTVEQGLARLKEGKSAFVAIGEAADQATKKTRDNAKATSDAGAAADQAGEKRARAAARAERAEKAAARAMRETQDQLRVLLGMAKALELAEQVKGRVAQTASTQVKNAAAAEIAAVNQAAAAHRAKTRLLQAEESAAIALARSQARLASEAKARADATYSTQMRVAKAREADAAAAVRVVQADLAHQRQSKATEDSLRREAETIATLTQRVNALAGAKARVAGLAAGRSGANVGLAQDAARASVGGIIGAAQSGFDRRAVQVQNEMAEAAKKAEAAMRSQGAAGGFLAGVWSRLTSGGQGFLGFLGALFQGLGRLRVGLLNARFAIALFFGSMAIGPLVELTDQMTALEARVGLYAKTQAEVPAILAEVYQTAQRARAPLEGVSKLYTRLAPMSDQLGRSQKELLRVVETVSKAFAIGGASAAEATSSAQQFAQAISSNRFGGDELRSVAENAPVLLQAIAEGVNKINPALNLNAATFIKWAQKGNATSEIMVKALENAQGKIDAMFKNFPVTIGQATTTVGNAFAYLIGEVNKSTQASAKIAALIMQFANFLESRDTIEAVTDAVSGLIELFEILGKVLGTVGDILPTVVAALAALLIVRTVTAAVVGLNLAMGSSGLISVCIAAGNAMAVMRARGALLFAAMGGPWGVAITALVGALTYMITTFNQANETLSKSGAAWGDTLNETMGAIDRAIMFSNTYGLATDDLSSALQGVAGASNVAASAADAKAGADRQAREMAIARAEAERALTVELLRQAGAKAATRGDELRSSAKTVANASRVVGASAAFANSEYDVGASQGAPAAAAKMKADSDQGYRNAVRQYEVAEKLYKLANSLEGKTLTVPTISDSSGPGSSPAGKEEKGKKDKAAEDLKRQIEDLQEKERQVRAATAAIKAQTTAANSASNAMVAYYDKGERGSAGYVAALLAQAEAETKAKETAAELTIAQEFGAESIAALPPAIRSYVDALLTAEKANIRAEDAERRADQARKAKEGMAKAIADNEAYAKAVNAGREALFAFERQQRINAALLEAGPAADAKQVENDVDRLLSSEASGRLAERGAALRDELEMVSKTADQREIEVRAIEMAKDLAQQLGRTDYERFLVQARTTAELEDQQAYMARMKGSVKDDIKAAFIETGKLDFSPLARAIGTAVRKRVYEALIQKPMDIIVDAVVNVVAKGLDDILKKLAGSNGQGGDILGTISNIFKPGGAGGDFLAKFGQAGTAIGSAVSSIASVVPYVAAAQATNMAIGNMLGFDKKQMNATKWFGVIGGLLVGKESNHGAYAKFNESGKAFTLGGSKATKETTAAASEIGTAMVEIMSTLEKVGIDGSGIISAIDIGTRDKTHIRTTDGRDIRSAVGDTKAAVEAATRLLLKEGVYENPQMKKMVDQMLAANLSLEDMVAKLDTFVQAQKVPANLKLDLLRYTDPREYQLQSLRNSQVDRRKQIKDFADQGFYTEAQKSEINATLNLLEQAELRAALEQLADGANGAAASLAKIKDAQAEIAAYVAGLITGQLSPLSPSAKLAASEAEFNALLAKAQNGDLKAMEEITSKATDYLSAAQSYYGSSPDYVAIFDQVRTALDALSKKEFSDPLIAQIAEQTRLLQEAIAAAAAVIVTAIAPPANDNLVGTEADPAANAGNGLGGVTVNVSMEDVVAALADTNQRLAHVAEAVVATNGNGLARISDVVEESNGMARIKAGGSVQQAS